MWTKIICVSLFCASVVAAPKQDVEVLVAPENELQKRQTVPEIPAEEAKEYDKLILQLGSDSFLAREAAHRKLEKAGLAAFKQLEDGLENEDPEIKSRCSHIIFHYYRPAYEKPFNIWDLPKEDRYKDDVDLAAKFYEIARRVYINDGNEYYSSSDVSTSIAKLASSLYRVDILKSIKEDGHSKIEQIRLNAISLRLAYELEYSFPPYTYIYFNQIPMPAIEERIDAVRKKKQTEIEERRQAAIIQALKDSLPKTEEEDMPEEAPEDNDG